MIIAMPCRQQRVAGHFSRAPQLAFYDTERSSLQTIDNPASLSDDCHAKKAMAHLLESMKVDALIVRHIGQRMLARLLGQGVRVFQLGSGMNINQAITAPFTDMQYTEITSASQGRPSHRHQGQHQGQHQEGQCGESRSCCGHQKGESRSRCGSGCGSRCH